MLKNRSEAYFVDVSELGYPAMVWERKLYVKDGNIYRYNRKLAYKEHIPNDARLYISKADLARMTLGGEIE